MASFHGWNVVWAAFLLAVFTWGIGFYGPGVFIATLSEGRGWPLPALSAAVTLHFLVSAGLLAQLPEWHRRFGLGAVTRVGVLASVAGVLGWGFARELWQVFPAALLTGVGWSLTSGAAVNAMIAPWFDRGRPRALSLAYNGASVGGILLTPLWALLTLEWGFGAATLLVGATYLALAWPLVGRVIARRPEELGQWPDGAPAPARAATPPAPARDRAALLADPHFRWLTAAFSVALFAQMALVTHLFALLLPALGAEGAGFAMSLVTIAAMAGRTVSGWVMPAGPRRRLAAAATFLIQALGSLALLAAGGDGIVLLVLGCIGFGIGVGNLLSLPPLIVQAEFPAAEMGRVVALIAALNQGVYALAPAGFGLLRALGGPDAALALVLGMQLLALGLILHRPGEGERG
jgi:MFS family permease